MPSTLLHIHTSTMLTLSEACLHFSFSMGFFFLFSSLNKFYWISRHCLMFFLFFSSKFFFCLFLVFWLIAPFFFFFSFFLFFSPFFSFPSLSSVLSHLHSEHRRSTPENRFPMGGGGSKARALFESLDSGLQTTCPCFSLPWFNSHSFFKHTRTRTQWDSETWRPADSPASAWC